MKKRMTIAIALALALVLSLSAFSSAAQFQPYNNTFRPELTFDGTTAKCYVMISSVGDEISVTLTLRYGGTRCATWYANGTSAVTIEETKEVTKGYTYTLTVSGTINGKLFEPASVSGTCR